jgi:hypothetical protein
MMRKFGIALILLTLLSTLSGAANKPNPADILVKSLEAHGGWKAYAALPILSFQGSFTIKTGSTSLSGSLTHIIDNTGCERFEYDSSLGRAVEGTNMETQWEMIHDAPLIIHNDATTQSELEIRKLIATFQHLYSDSNVFRLKYKGLKDFHGAKCHIIRVENKRNNNRYTYFINTLTYIIQGLERIDSQYYISYYYQDYQPVRGFMFPMQVQLQILPQKQTTNWNFSKVLCLDDATPAIFDPPAMAEETTKTQKAIDTY